MPIMYGLNHMFNKLNSLDVSRLSMQMQVGIFHGRFVNQLKGKKNKDRINSKYHNMFD